MKLTIFWYEMYSRAVWVWQFRLLDLTCPACYLYLTHIHAAVAVPVPAIMGISAHYPCTQTVVHFTCRDIYPLSTRNQHPQVTPTSPHSSPLSLFPSATPFVRQKPSWSLDERMS